MNRREFIVGAAVAGASFSALGRAAVGRGVSSVAPTEVLVAGEPQAFASMRVQAQCMAMGEAVGTAAAMCARTRIKPRDLDVSGLIAKLRSQKVYLG